MKTFIASERLLLLGFFISVITVGAILLNLPFSWNPGAEHGILDGIFTSVSAVCVTGLTTVPTSSLSIFGQWVLLALIQFGGLGIITITTLYLVLPWARISFKNTRIIKEFFLEKVENKPRKIIGNILLYTFLIEGIGIILLWLFQGAHPDKFFYALFHGVSAFCNAGFGLEDDSLLSWQGNPGALTIISLLIILGGLGWVVIKNIFQKILKKTRHLSFHTMVVLFTTAILIFSGFLIFFIIERISAPPSRPWWLDLGNSIFYSITTRTAGFNVLFPSDMSPISQILSIPFMIIGASPGSTGGGVKTTTFVLFFLFVLRGMDEDDTRLALGEHRILRETVQKAAVIFIRYFILYLISSLILYSVERVQNSHLTFIQILFETASAFGTVGLSLDTTSHLSVTGKWIIILNMFVGRVGLLAFSLSTFTREKHFTIKKPRGEVMIG